MVSGASASEDHVDNCEQMTGISTMEVLPQIYVQVMLENTSVLKVITRESLKVLLKTNEFVKQIRILPTFICFVSLKKN